MTDSNFTGHTKYSTLGGIITILFYNIGTGDVVKTMVLAAIGAFVSFFISLVLRYCMNKWRK
jgi:hypothetical protein